MPEIKMNQTFQKNILDKNKIEAIESAMKKLNMDFVSQM